jgi:hypothetical protein
MRKIWLGISTMVLLFSCGSGTGDKKKDLPEQRPGDTASVKKDTASPVNDASYLVFTGDSVLIPPFEIDVSLSTKAEQKLKKDKETIIVKAYFSGIPKDTTIEEYKKTGSLSLASAEKELFAGRTAGFAGIKFSKALYDSLGDKNITLLINIYSGRRASKDNLLNCDILEDKMSNLKGRKFTIKGKLIYGDD